ncbi:MAG: hypothetical protein HGB10_01380 [Coriobacteriia bacterium]|nr:hypothetical protein [Coriobacteriia bacterium]
MTDTHRQSMEEADARFELAIEMADRTARLTIELIAFLIALNLLVLALAVLQ